MRVLLVIIPLFLVVQGFESGFSNSKSIRPLVPPTGRIIGGEESPKNAFPYQVALSINYGSALCGGALISENYVITAAHCAVAISDVEIILGAHNWTTTESTQTRTTASAIKVHEEYSDILYRNDIALLKLETPVEFTEFIKPVALPQDSDVGKSYEGSSGISSGWGLIEDKPFPNVDDTSDVLRNVTVDVLSLEDCKEYYNSEETPYIAEGNICTTGYRNKGTCNGDSGGPFVINDVLVGIVSFGTTECEACSPSVYTRVDYHLEWIAAHMQD